MHSIIIPHRNRLPWLRHTLWSIQHSARICDWPSYEVIIVNEGPSTELDDLARRSLSIRVVEVTARPGPLCKTRLLNVGIEASSGEILSFVDADMLVGPKWMGSPRVFTEIGGEVIPTKISYRVWALPEKESEALWKERLSDWEYERWLMGWLRKCQLCPATFQRLFEAYGKAEDSVRPWRELPPFGSNVIGNSQFTILRRVLGDLRFNEEYVGRGFEDIWMMREIQRKYRENYCGLILTEPWRAMLHIEHEEQSKKETDWNDEKLNRQNRDRYVAS